MILFIFVGKKCEPRLFETLKLKYSCFSIMIFKNPD